MTFVFKQKNHNIVSLYDMMMMMFNLVNFDLDFKGTSMRAKNIKFMPVVSGMKLHHLSIQQRFFSC